MEGRIRRVLKSVKLSKEDALVHSKWRRLIRHTVLRRIVMMVGLMCLIVSGTSSSGLSWIKGP